MDATLSSSFLTNAFHISSSPSQSQSHKNIAIQSIVSNNTISHTDISTKSSPLNKTLKKIITRPPFGPCLDPESVLSNNYAPVEELPPTECLTIEGTLPPCLDGAYIRNGPNPQHPPYPPYHLFDGDGMLHCLRISNGRATLCSRYVKTNKYLVEHEAGSPIFPNILTSLIVGLPKAVADGIVFMVRHLCGHCNALEGFGLANTSVGYFGNKLFALAESDLPYQICITPHGDVETIGRYDFDGKFSTLSNMTSHLKVDAQTGETFAFRFSSTFPFLTYFRFDINGTKQEDAPIKSLTRLAFFHDFAITKKFAVFADSQIGVSTNLMDLIGGKAIVGADRRKIPRIGVIPRYATDDSEMRWFDVPGFNNMHAINAWDEEDDDIVLIAPNITPVEHALERMDLVHTSVEKVRINLKSGKVTRSSMSRKRLDFGVVNPAFLGRKNRYGYLAVGNPKPSGLLKLEGFSGVVKLDWSSEEEKEVGCRMFREGCYGGEPFFVPRGNAEGGEEEDNGYLVTYVHNENSGESRFLVMDAKSPTLDIVAAVKLPQRVPYGFHGLFVKESDLEKL